MRRQRNESTVLHAIRAAPWRRGAPKAQDGCASKRHPSTQRTACQLCKALLRIVNGSEAVGSLPYSYASKCTGRETKARYYMPYEQPLEEGARRRRRMDVPRRGTLLRREQHANSAKRDFVSSFRAKREIFVIRGLASMIGNSKRETCYPLTLGHRPIYIAAKLLPQP